MTQLFTQHFEPQVKSLRMTICSLTCLIALHWLQYDGLNWAQTTTQCHIILKTQPKQNWRRNQINDRNFLFKVFFFSSGEVKNFRFDSGAVLETLWQTHDMGTVPSTYIREKLSLATLSPSLVNNNQLCWRRKRKKKFHTVFDAWVWEERKKKLNTRRTLTRLRHSPLWKDLDGIAGGID